MLLWSPWCLGLWLPSQQSARRPLWPGSFSSGLSLVHLMVPRTLQECQAPVPPYCGEKQAAPPASTLGQSSQALNTMLPIEGLARIKGWGSQYLFEPIETSIGPPATRLTEP